MSTDNAPQPWTCVVCDEEQPAEDTRHHWLTDTDEVFWLGKPKMTGPACAECKFKRDNYDGPDDGDAWAGGFAENH